MSLFKTREWWVAEVGDGEALDDICDSGSLLAAHLNSEDSEAVQLVVGSFTGSLNIYSPQASKTEDGEDVSGYRPDHLLLETHLNYPVLQLLAGALVGSGSAHQQLCVLHPLRLVVYGVNIMAGVDVRGSQGGESVPHGLQAKLTPAYQHAFKRQAHSAVIGHFGSVRGKEFLCVQSLDGCLSVYEQESFAFCVFLPNALLAGPLVYLHNMDAFATMAASGTLQCYRYQNLASSRAADDGRSGEEERVGGRRLLWDWEQVLGEEALDMQVVGEAPLVTLLLLTTRGFYAYKETGGVKFVKRLEYSPACFTTYTVGVSVFVCVVTHTQALLVYHETVLKWAAQLPCQPVAIRRTSFKSISGGLSLVTGAGRVSVVYLGTDPSLFAAPPVEAREINYEETDKELAQLHRVIKSSTKDTSTLLGSEDGPGRHQQQLNVSCTVGQKLEPWNGPSSVQDPDGGPVPCCTAVVRVTAQQPTHGVRVAVCVNKPLSVSQAVFMLRTISDSSQVLVRFYLSAAYVACSLSAEVVTSYTTSRGAPRVIRTQLELPLRLVVKAAAPVKEAEHKITLSTNKPAVNLPELFPEFGLDSAQSSTGVGLQHFAGPLVTVLSSRTTHRYRLQSDSLASLWVVFREMCRRLTSYWGTGGRQGAGEDKLTLSVASTLPLNELYSLIDAHFLRRKKHDSLNEQLVQRCMQVRAVQRRLLTKFKDKNPTPLTNLDNLLDGMYKQVLHITDLIQDNTSVLEHVGAQLSCVGQLVLELLRLHHNPSNHELLKAALTHPLPTPQQGQGWEEVVNCCVSHLLRTVYNGGGQGGGAPPQLTAPLDTAKLKKNISLLLDKMTKGGLEQAQQQQDAMEITDGDPVPAAVAEDPVEVPLGSRLGEDRVRSARIRSARLKSASSRMSSALSRDYSADTRPQTVVEEDDGTPYQAAIEELDIIRTTKDDGGRENEGEENEDEPKEEDEDAKNSDEDARDEALPVATREENEEENVDDEGDTKVNQKPPKSAKGVEGPNIESPAVDIFGNPEDEDLW